jgi:type IV secretion system protein VirD4
VEVARSKGEQPTFQAFIDYLFSDDVVYNLAVVLDSIKTLPPFAYKAIAAYLQKADKERSGVLSTAHSYLTPFISEALNVYLNHPQSL